MPIEDLTGKRFGMLTVIELAYTKDRKNYWLCRCDCGNVKIIRQDPFKTSRKQKTVSCGCYNRSTKKCEKNIKPHRDSKLYRVYYGMKERCYNEKCKSFKYYGGKGVKICDEWLNDFDAFYEWSIINGYEEGLSIDRIDVDGNYEPSNCRWATKKEQLSNTTRNRRYEYKGEFLTITELAEKYNINRNTLNYRLNNGWEISKAIELPPTPNALNDNHGCFKNK